MHSTALSSQQEPSQESHTCKQGRHRGVRCARGSEIPLSWQDLTRRIFIVNADSSVILLHLVCNLVTGVATFAIVWVVVGGHHENLLSSAYFKHCEFSSFSCSEEIDGSSSCSCDAHGSTVKHKKSV